MLLADALVGARFLHYAALTTLFGVALFPLYAFARGHGGLDRMLRSARIASAAATLVTGVAWFLLSSANMSGDLSALTDPSSLWFVASETPFGHVSLARGALAVVTLAAAFSGSRWLSAVLSGVLLASIAMTGHTQVEKGLAGAVHIAADGLHLLAAGAWLGALVPLVALAATGPAKLRDNGVDIGAVLARFSTVGVAAVAALVLTGVVNSWFLVGEIGALFTTTYGKVLCAKLVLFGGMLLLAAANRFWITPALAGGPADAQARPWLRRLRVHVLWEQALGVLVLLVVGALGTLEPAAGHDAAVASTPRAWTFSVQISLWQAALAAVLAWISGALFHAAVRDGMLRPRDDPDADYPFAARAYPLGGWRWLKSPGVMVQLGLLVLFLGAVIGLIVLNL